MGKIDREGTFLGTVVEGGLNLTKEKQYPQFVAKLRATKFWADTPELMKYYNITEPGYVDYPNDEFTGYFVLFKSASDFDQTTKLLNYDQLQVALGWDGTSFDSLADGSQNGKEVLFRIANNEYNGKTSLQVAWIDSKDADASPKLRTLDANDVKTLSAKLKAGGLGKAQKPTPAPAKPAAAKAPAPAVVKPATPAAAAPAATTVVSATPATKKAAPAKKAATKVEDAGPPAETTMEEAWGYLQDHKGANEDTVIEETWMAACTEVLGDRDQDQATPKDWAKIRDTVVKDLALD